MIISNFQKKKKTWESLVKSKSQNEQKNFSIFDYIAWTGTHLCAYIVSTHKSRILYWEPAAFNSQAN